MKIFTLVIRLLMGLLFLFGSITFLFQLMPQPELTGNVKLFMDGMNATGFMMPLIKVTELLCGIAFVTGFFVPLASVVIAPVIINIFLFHTLVEPSGFPVGVFLVVANLVVAYSHREKFLPILKAR
jgi:uncharacterized membrane protein YphA (DoxX/SURF4 family)